MKHKMIFAMALLPLFIVGAEQTFQLDFNNNNIKPVIAKGSRSPMKPVKLDPQQNLPDGIIGKGLRNGITPPLEVTFSARKNINFPSIGKRCFKYGYSEKALF